jgi:acyl-CoA synthetase (NDP forming)
LAVAALTGLRDRDYVRSAAPPAEPPRTDTLVPGTPVESLTLRPLFAPTSVAIVGASSDPTRIGGRPIQYALAARFKGRLYPVNPNHDEIQGLKSYPDLGSIPDKIDLVIIAVPAARVAASVARAVQCGIKAAIILSAGFAESGAEGRKRQDDIQDLCRESGMRVLGPNCLGLFNAAIGHTATFASFLQDDVPADGRIALVSQSGAYASYIFMLASKRGIRIGQWVTTGNEMDVGIADAIDYLVEDSGILALACVAEGIRQGQSFIRALERARRAGKPVVLLKMGRSASGVEAARSHTAALAVDDAVLDAVARQAGALRVTTTQELLDVLYGLQLRPPLAGRKLGIVSVSGGAAVLMADAASACGLSVPALPLATQRRLQDAIPFATMTNPVDLTAQILNDLTPAGLPIRAMLAETGYDAVVAFFMNYLASPVTGTKLRAILAAALEGLEDRTLALIATGPQHIIEHYEQRGILVFDDPARAIATLAAMARIGEGLRAPAPEVQSTDGMPLVCGDERDEVRAKEILARLGLQSLREAFVTDPLAAAAAAATLGVPVSLKVVSADLPHKSDVGGVRLGIVGADMVEAAAQEMLTVVKQHRPSARIDGFLISPMVSDGIEMIMAAHIDRVFGPTVMLGFGGLLVEVTRDVVFRYGAIDLPEAYRMVDELRGRALLDGGRGRPPSDIDALVNTVVLVSRFGAANVGRLESAEINPLLVRSQGNGCLVLDALLTFPDRQRRQAEDSC